MVKEHEPGYSAIQLVVVLALAMILVTGAVAGFRKAFSRETLDGWARTMAFDIAAGRQAAITRRATITVTLSASSYLVANGGVALRYAPLPPDITVTTTCPASICSFDRRGVPIAAGTITLTSASTGQSRVVTIQTSTGRVSYQ
jgi:Type II transport protein GspH